MSKKDKNMINESFKETSPMLSIKKMELILQQMKNCICKIEIENTIGTAFFAKIDLNNNSSLTVLITALHTLNNTNSKCIKIYLNNKKEEEKRIILDNSRIIYKNKECDIFIIEIKSQDKINTQ